MCYTCNIHDTISFVKDSVSFYIFKLISFVIAYTRCITTIINFRIVIYKRVLRF